jgi:hypothetical protein
MSDDTINHLMRRIDRLEAATSGHNSVGWSQIDEIHQALKKLQIAISDREAKTARNNKYLAEFFDDRPTRKEVIDRHNKLVGQLQTIVAELISSSTVASEKFVTRETDEKLVSIKADAAAAKTAASANVTAAQKLILDYASQLGS